MKPRSVLVIGAGPAGLISLRNLLELGEFERVELVERRDDVGGVWYLDVGDPSKPFRPRWPSPAYPGLIGNVLPKFLSFSKFPFPATADPRQPFPTLTQTHEYLKAFAAPYIAQGRIRLNTEVTRVEELADGAGWKVQLKDWNLDQDDRTKEEIWDAVVVSVCWYDNPVWPETDGLDILRDKGLAIPCQPLEGSCWIIQSIEVFDDPAFPGFVSLADERIADVAPVRKYMLNPSDKITAILHDGTEIADIDIVQVGTGYRPYPAFVHVLDPSTKEVVPLMHCNITPHRVPSLHRLILYAYNPSLAFIGTAAISYTPFTIADVTSTWLTLAWQEEIPYPSTAEELLKSESDRLAAIAKYRAEEQDPSSLVSYNVLSVYEEEYAAGMKRDIVKARPVVEGLAP